MSEPTVSIERAGPQDAGELLTVQRAAYVTEAQLYGDPFLPPLVESVEQLRNALAGDAVFLKAVLDGRVVGAVRAQFSDHTCLIGRLVVVPDLQGRGIGGRLLAALEAEVGGRADACVLFTGHLSETNLRLYRRLGYTETHRERVAAHLTLVHMRKPLVPVETA
ncbi:ribosomal protein S18 acetylase RimI-like enzyme [Actinomadura pelletieri DSM 43383]|uniref:Ribosomal protein S18 acetylase RimI-like enzyme n=1 Tax=Actinomadura pelletieri DSM 43383 TaxID=1120940 RepID=A0A495QNA8_9ACTN|nr:GNAT family N-acetyltransferase [Actinomadura pelletieri]RKS74431.1 ribosomal protein S18 acetylase RimI-like enzyme [Actinomadura pelletieri DSM 43383]